MSFPRLRGSVGHGLCGPHLTRLQAEAIDLSARQGPPRRQFGLFASVSVGSNGCHSAALIRFRDIVALGHESGLHEPGFRGPYPPRNRQIREPAMDSTKRHERFADHAYTVTPFAAQYNEVHGRFGG